MNMGWPFWTVAIIMGAYVAYRVFGPRLLAAVIRQWKTSPPLYIGGLVVLGLLLLVVITERN